MTIKEETLNSNIETVNSKQLATLKKNFPQCFDKKGAFIQEKLLEIINENEIELSKESYTLNWLGKSYARLLTNLPPKTLIKEDIKHNKLKKNKSSQNLLIKGDNLEVLKHMLNAYSEKVKMIYIDPPYNTGSDGFVYKDDRKFTKEQLSELAGIELDEAERILEFTDKGSNSHSAWLTFMYPRLYVARELLQEDGVIFISIDDNEVAQLKLICDEVFGEANFIANFLWKKKSTTSNVKDAQVSPQVDYQLCYGKSNKSRIKQRVKTADTRTYPHSDDDGKYRLAVLEKKDSGSYKRNTMKFNILGHKPRKGKRWQIGEQTAKKLEEKGRLIWDGEKIQQKIYETEDHDTFSAQPNLLDKHGTSDGGAKLTNIELFGVSELFDNPKPIELIKHLLTICSDKNDLILDFFAGSGSTAHAVMQANVDDGGSRRCLSVQLPELTDEDSEAYRAGYKSIFDITKSRIIKSAKKIIKENPSFKGDLGFKIFEVIEDFRSNNESELTFSNLTFFDDMALTDKQYRELMTTWCLYDGSLLTTEIQLVELGNYKAYLCDDRLYLIYSNFSSKYLKMLLKKIDSDKDFTPNKVIIYGGNFESAQQMGLHEALKSYANKKSLEIDLLVRY